MINYANNIEMQVEKDEGVTIIVIKGCLDHKQSTQLWLSLLENLKSFTDLIVIDLSELSLLTNAGVVFLLNIKDKININESELVICSSTQTIRDHLLLAGVQLRIKVLGSRSEAVSYLLNGVKK